MTRKIVFAFFLLGSLCIVGCGGSGSGSSGGGGGTQKTTPTVSAWPTASAITYGQMLTSSTLTGGAASTSGTFAWTTPSTAPSAGAPPENVTFSPSDATDYNTVTGSVSVTVNQAAPTVSAWPVASAIASGQALSSSTLTGGTASVPGMFAWTTPTTTPPQGIDSESVTFTPTDTTDYASVTANVSITVTRAAPSGSWQESGPPGGSGITVLAEDPSSPNTIYADGLGNGASGLWRSVDSGTTWTPMITNSVMDQANVSDLAVVNAGQVFYASAKDGMGFYTSIDGGITWTSEPLPSGSVLGGMAVDPQNNATIYLSAPGTGVIKSVNGGSTWTLLASSPVITTGSVTAVLHNPIEVDPTNSSIVYYGTDHGLYISTDAGATWTLSANGIPSGNVEIRDVAVDPAAPSEIFLLAGLTGETVVELYESTNVGSSWTPLATGLDAERVVPDPNNSSIIYLYGLEIHAAYKSTDGGQTFAASDSGTPSAGSSGSPGGSLVISGPTGTMIPLATSPGSYLLAIGGSGVYQTTNAAQSWSFSSTGLSAWNGDAVAFDPEVPTTIYFGSLNGGGIFKSTDSGVTWINVEGPDSITDIAVDPFDSTHLLAVSQDEGLIASHDGGDTWANISSNLPSPNSFAFISGVHFHPGQEGTIFVGDLLSGFMLSSDGGATFTSANTGLSTTDVGGCIAVNPQNPQMLLIADAAGLAISTDGGNTWTETASQTTCPFSVDAKANPFIVYALGTNGAVKSTDFGETWTALNIRANVVADPSTANSAFAVGGEGGSWSPDAGTTWYSLLTNGWGESSLEPGGFEGSGVWASGAGMTIAPSSPQVMFVASWTNSLWSFVVGP